MKIAALCILLTAVVCTQSACRAATVDGETVLTICMEEAVEGGGAVYPRPDLIVKDIAERMTENDPGVLFKITEIPGNRNGDSTERDAYIKRMRVEMMAGKGPDIFLLPSVTRSGGEPLIGSVEKSMANGTFADLSEYAKQDSDFVNCIEPVMNAGVYGGKRYVIPLQYSYPLMIALSDEFEKTGMNRLSLEASYSMFLSEASKPKEAWWRRGATELVSSNFYTGFVNAVDYENQRVLIPEDNITHYVDAYMALSEGVRPRADNEYPGDYGTYAAGEMKLTRENPLYVPFGGNPLNTLMAVAELKDSNDEYLCIPLPNAQGRITPRITCFAAVSASCRAPDKAYEFIRHLLSKEVQLGSNGPAPVTGTPTAFEAKDFLFLNGWPIRQDISIQEMWQACMADDYVPEKELIELTDKDFEIDASLFDNAKFECHIDSEFRKMLWLPYWNGEELSDRQEISGRMYRLLKAEAME